MINPFSYGKPIDDPARFIGRHREIEQVYSRLMSAFESSSIVSERSIGKTSLLKMIAHSDTQAKFGLDPEKYTFIYQDFQFLDESTSPTRFWQRVLRSIERAVKDHEAIAAEIDQAVKAETIDNYTLDDIFTLIDEEDLYVILLLDEFENVTRNQQFDSDFFGGLRALAIHHNLALITSSRQDLVELTHSEAVRSSPFFNIFATLNLRAFSETEATELIDTYLADTGVKFLLSELNCVFAIAGYHPYFLQMACHHLFAAHEKELDETARRHYLNDQVRQAAAPLFQNYWRNSSPPQQVLLTVLALRQLERNGGEDTIEELEGFFTRADQVIADLERRSLVIKNPDNAAYHLFSTELAEWICDEIVGDVDDLRAWRDWQKSESIIATLPMSVQDMLAQVIGGLNAEYRTTLGNWLLESSTSTNALKLLGNFLGRYEEIKATRPERSPAATLADEQAPVGDTPRGLSAGVSQQLEESEKEAPPGLGPAPSAQVTPPLEEKTDASGRTLSRLKKKSAISPVAIGGLIISGLITTIDLEAEDQSFVNNEFQWLFGATDHLLKVCRGEIDRNQPVGTPIPPHAQQVPGANNQLLSTFQDSDLQFWDDWTELRLKRISTALKNLDLLLDHETSRGAAGKGDVDLQNKIKNERIEIVKTSEEMAQLMNQAYGVLVTSPGQLVQLLQE